MLGKVHKWFDSFVDTMASLSAIVLAFLTAAVCCDVFLRYVFVRPISGVVEVVEFGLVFYTLLAAPQLLRADKHVRMDLVLQRFGPRAQAGVNLVTSTISTALCGVITWYGLASVIERFQTGHKLPTTLEPYSWPLFAIIPLAMFLLFIQFLILIRGYYRVASGRIPSEGELVPAAPDLKLEV